jgi:hypothetical protein
MYGTVDRPPRFVRLSHSLPHLFIPPVLKAEKQQTPHLRIRAGTGPEPPCSKEVDVRTLPRTPPMGKGARTKLKIVLRTARTCLWQALPHLVGRAFRNDRIRAKSLHTPPSTPGLSVLSFVGQGCLGRALTRMQCISENLICGHEASKHHWSQMVGVAWACRVQPTCRSYCPKGVWADLSGPKFCL